MNLQRVELDAVCEGYLEYLAHVGRRAQGTVRDVRCTLRRVCTAIRIKQDTNGNGTYDTTEHFDSFTFSVNHGEEKPTHDAAGNLTYDGVYRYTYDAWNRYHHTSTEWQVWDYYEGSK